MTDYIDDPIYDIGDVSCAFCDVAKVAALVAAIGVVAVALGAWAINKMRLW